MKTNFRDNEKIRYERVKNDDSLFSIEACQKGHYNGIEREFCIADDYSYENLYKGIRDSAITYFLTRGIPWHDGIRDAHLPSNHLCCSQSCCVNFLFPLVNRPDLVKAIFPSYYPDFVEALPIIEDKRLNDGGYPFVAFEWTGNPNRDYLREGERKGRKPTRGANFTSADFVLRFREKNERVRIVLGEWKYTEEYGRDNKGLGRDGHIRKTTYSQFFKKKDGVLSKNEDSDKLYDGLFYEPFYQLMRLQLLAQEMEANKEMDADNVSILHVSPTANDGFRRNVTSAFLKERFPGKGVLEIWSELVPGDKFKSISAEDLLDKIVNSTASNSEWARYLSNRYGWSYHGNP